MGPLKKSDLRFKNNEIRGRRKRIDHFDLVLKNRDPRLHIKREVCYEGLIQFDTIFFYFMGKLKCYGLGLGKVSNQEAS